MHQAKFGKAKDLSEGMVHHWKVSTCGAGLPALIRSNLFNRLLGFSNNSCCFACFVVHEFSMQDIQLAISYLIDVKLSSGFCEEHSVRNNEGERRE